MKNIMAIHHAYAIVAIHLVYAVAIAIAQPTFDDDDIAPIPRVILPEPLPLIPGPGGSWSPESQPYVDSLISALQEQASSGKITCNCLVCNCKSLQSLAPCVVWTSSSFNLLCTLKPTGSWGS